MLSRTAKATFYGVANPFMRVNGVLHRYLKAPRAAAALKVHLGPGQKSYLEGWVNVDANMFTAKCDVWANLCHPLPFHDETVAAMYSHHVVEHLPDLEAHFEEVYRCLKRGGIYRVAGPHGDSAIKKFVEGDAAWFGDFPDRRRSVGGRFENFIFCRQEHLTILTYSYLEELMSDVGFADFRVCKPTLETHYPDIFTDCLPKEWESDLETPHTLVIEAVKAG